MEGNKEPQESTVSIIQPPKEKKLKQTRLPFQTVPSAGSPNTSTKKRKLSSPTSSPTSCKSPKVQKIGKKENSLKFIERIEAESINDKDNTTSESDIIDEKIEVKSSTKQGNISKFFSKTNAVSTKVSSSPIDDEKSKVPSPVESKTDIKNNLPIILLNKCDDKINVSNDSIDNIDKTNKAKTEKEKLTELQKLQKKKEREEKKKEALKKKEAEIEAKRKEKEQKELKKQIEIEQKQKEKEQKDLKKQLENEQKQKEREQKEEEKRKKEEEKLEAERKKQKVSSTFKNFFVPKKLDNKINEEIKTSNFMPFEIKADMKIAPACRRNFNNNDKLNFDNNCLIKKNEYTKELWLDEIRNNHYKIRKSGKTWPTESKDDDVIALEEEDDVESVNVVDQTTAITEKQRAKLLSFTENRRPPYWGTWRKKSDKINPKKPFNKDPKWFDYDVDSDEEWEEEEPGESLHGSDDEKEEENADDNEYDVDNEFMVPHGYLSDEEARPDEEDEEDMTPETQKFKLKILGEQFQAEMNEKTAKIKPRVIGIYWQNMENNNPDNTPESVIKYMTARQAWVREIPIELTKPIDQKIENEKSRGPKKISLPDEALSHLIKLIHGNTHNRKFLVKEFLTFWIKKHPDDIKLTKASIDNKINEIAKYIACPDEGLMYLKNCWWVSKDIRKQYIDEDIKLPNQWSYNLTPKRKIILDDSFDKTDKDIKEQKDKIEKEQNNKEHKNSSSTTASSVSSVSSSSSLITQFTQKITTEELKKQFKTTSPIIKSTNSLNRPPKRAVLISVPRGELIPPTSSISAFNKINEINKTKTNEEIIIIDENDKKEENVLN